MNVGMPKVVKGEAKGRGLDDAANKVCVRFKSRKHKVRRGQRRGRFGVKKHFHCAVRSRGRVLSWTMTTSIILILSSQLLGSICGDGPSVDLANQRGVFVAVRGE